MAMTDLVIRPGTKALRYASGQLDVIRFLFEDIEKHSNDRVVVRELARRGRGMMVSAKATVDHAIDDAVAVAIATEAGTAETENTGSVHEGAGPQGIAPPSAQPPSGDPQ